MPNQIAVSLDQSSFKRAFRYRLIFYRLKRIILSNKPRSELELRLKIHDYLRNHPRAAIIIRDQGFTEDVIISKLLPYAK